MSATIRPKMLFLPFHSQNERVKIYRNMICFLCYMGAKLGVSH